MNNFQGNEPIISRSLGRRTLLKTDAFLRWLAGEQGDSRGGTPRPVPLACPVPGLPAVASPSLRLLTLAVPHS